MHLEHLTAVCTGDTENLNLGHPDCPGWVAPLVYGDRACLCPCHTVRERPTLTEAHRRARQAYYRSGDIYSETGDV